MVWVVATGTPFEVSHEGQVRWARTGLPTPVRLTKSGYRVVRWKRSPRRFEARVCRLVCTAFYGAPSPDQQADHINADRTDDRSLNLRWLSRAENLARRPVGEDHHKAKLAEAQVRSVLASAASTKALARELGVDPSAIRDIRHGRTWTHLANNPAQAAA